MLLLLLLHDSSIMRSTLFLYALPRHCLSQRLVYNRSSLHAIDPNIVFVRGFSSSKRKVKHTKSPEALIKPRAQSRARKLCRLDCVWRGSIARYVAANSCFEGVSRAGSISEKEPLPRET